jgi:hypothetical protein
MWIDDGCGSCVFNALSSHDNVEYQLKIGTSGTVSSDYTEPTAITFIAPMLEWIGVSATSDAVATVVIEGAARCAFINGIVTGALGLSSARPAIKMSVVAPAVESTLNLIGTNVFGNVSYTTAFTMANYSRVFFSGHNSITNCLVGFAVTGASAFIHGSQPELISVTTNYTFAGGAYQSTTRYNEQYYEQRFLAYAAADRIFAVQNPGEAGFRRMDTADGALGWGDGSGFSPDTNLYRSGADVLKTDDKLMVALELEIDGALNHDGSSVGFYGTTPVAKQTGVAVSSAGIHAALVNLGLIGA